MIDAVAIAGACGLPVDRIVDADPLEMQFWMRVAERAARSVTT